MNETDKLAPLKGSIRLSRPYGGGTDYFTIEIEDESSMIRFVEAQFSVKDFANLMTNREAECTFNLHGIDCVGMKREHKTEPVPFDYDYKVLRKDRAGLDDCQRSPLADKALKPFEVDGWKGSPSDLFNGHRTARGATGKTQTVGFVRWVPKKT